MMEWFEIENIEETDSPALVIYPDRITRNIELAKQILGDTNRLRPHVKTNKIAEVCRMMMDAGITKFKCATIPEAEMLATLQAPDVLLAYQPTAPKIKRLIALISQFTQTRFSCLIDNIETAKTLSSLAAENKLVIPVFIDINTGMNRTGIAPQHVIQLVTDCKDVKGIWIEGLHAYDGHFHDVDFETRKQKSDAAFAVVEALQKEAEHLLSRSLLIVAGGTPTFPVHALRQKVECSPGTFIFWDWGYHHKLPEQLFEYAAVLVTRVISVIDDETICTDLGHKSVAAENPMPRVHFLNAPHLTALSQSEEHLVLKTATKHQFKVGDVLYGVPVHICPTVALYDTVSVAENHRITGSWKVVARDRYISI